MQKSMVALIFLLLTSGWMLNSCSEEPVKKKETVVKSQGQEHDVEISDTAWMRQEDSRDVHIESVEWDTSIMIGGVPHTLAFRSVPIDAPFRYVYSNAVDDTLYAAEALGSNCTFDFRLYGPDDRVVFQKSYSKEDFAAETNMFHLAATSAWMCHFSGYHEKYDAFFIDMWFGYPDSDNAIRHPLFLGRDGSIKMQFDDCSFDNACDCSEQPSSNGSLFSFCSLVLNHEGDIYVVEDPDKEVAGSFPVSNDRALVVYMHEGKPPYNNAQVIQPERGVLYEFDFEGVGGDLGYSVPHFELEESEKFVLVDGIQRLLFVFEADAIEPRRLEFDDVPEATEEVLSVSKEHKVYTYTEVDSYSFYEFEGEIYKK